MVNLHTMHTAQVYTDCLYVDILEMVASRSKPLQTTPYLTHIAEKGHH